MKTQKQVIKYIKNNYGFWIKVIAILAFAYAIKQYFFTRKINHQIEKKHMLELYKIFNIKIDKKNKTLTKNNKTISYADLNNHAKTQKYKGNKKFMNDILLKNNIPVCKNIKWNDNLTNSKNIKLINKNLKFPVVVKPIYGQKGYGIKTNIYNNEILVKHIDFLKKQKWPKNIDINKGILIEEQEIGNKYRIVILNGKVIYIKLDDVPYIIGNGNSSVKQLIKDYHIINKDTNPIKNVSEDLILQQGYRVDDILEKNKKIQVTNIISKENGSQDYIIHLDSVHPDNIKMFIEINRVLKYNMSGIDYITQDLSTSHKISGKVLEVNSYPGWNKKCMKDKDISYRFVDALFPSKKV